MLHPVKPRRTYDPEMIAVMTTAFDRVCQTFSSGMNGNDAAKPKLSDGHWQPPSSS
jgi:hypothetical protein